MATSRENLLKGLSATSIKLDGKNYLLWKQAFETILGAHLKIRHLMHDPPDVKDLTYEDWLADDCAMITWLVNSMEEQIAQSVMMLKSAKKLWDALHATYGNEKKIARIYEIYEHLFTHRQGEKTIEEFISTLRALLDELEVYQPFVVDISKIR